MTLFAAGQRLTASALNHMYGAADASTRTNSANTSFAPISSQYVIGGGDAAVGTVYRLTTWGLGTQGSTPQVLGFRGNTIGGSGLNAVTIGSGFATTGAQFRWWARMICLVSQTGSAGTLTGFIEGGVVQTGTSNATTNFNAEWQGSGVSTAANWGIEIDTEWGSATGSPSISCAGTLFERVG